MNPIHGCRGVQEVFGVGVGLEMFGSSVFLSRYKGGVGDCLHVL